METLREMKKMFILKRLSTISQEITFISAIFSASNLEVTKIMLCSKVLLEIAAVLARVSERKTVDIYHFAAHSMAA